MALRERISRAFRSLRERQRRTWVGPERVWVELRDLQDGDFELVVGQVIRRLEAEPGVLWARFNGRYDRLVVAYEADRITASEVIDRVDAIEDALGFGQTPLSCDPSRHPADTEPVRRALGEIGLQAASLVAGLSLRLSSARVRARHIDMAAITTALRGVPRLRLAVEQQLGPRGAEVVLEAADAVTRALMQGTSGAAVDLVQHGLEVRERRARRRMWEAWEPRLAADPELHPRSRIVREERIQELPAGPLEQYVDSAVLASLGAFAFGLATTGDAEVATAPLFGGIPRPARVGRATFVRQLALRFARVGVLVQHAEAFEAIDQVDALVIDGILASDPRLEPVLTDARDAGIHIVAFGRTEERPIAVDQVVAARSVRDAIRRLQVQGRVVALVALGDCGGLPLADLSLGVVLDGSIPWTADLLCEEPGRVEAIALLVGGIVAGREAARHAVWLSGAEAVTSMVMALGGVRRQALRHILEASNLAALLALLDSVRIVRDIDTRVPEVGAAGPPWHALEVEEVLERLGTELRGLPDDEVVARRPEGVKPPSRVRQILGITRAELDNPLTPVLAGGAAISALVGSPVDAGMVLSVIALNGLVGAVQRYRTEQGLAALTRPEDTLVQVRRRAGEQEARSSELVVGDIVCLRAGDVVPADCRVLEADGLEVDEASLTGESLPVGKSAAPSQGALPSERASMLYEGTVIAAGSATAVVVATGDATEANRALRLHHRVVPRGVEARLESLTRLTVPVATAAGMALMAAGVLRRREPQDLVGDAVALAVASVPEGLPLLATVAQLSAARRLGVQQALVRHPRAVEALGRMQVLCADKTGTLTEGRLRLAAVSDGRETVGAQDLDEARRTIVALALLASPEADGDLAHLTDQAVVDGAASNGILIQDAHEDGATWERVEELPFEPSRSFAATLGRIGRQWTLAVKGSPEAVLERCVCWRVGGQTQDLGDDLRAELLAEADALAGRGYRVLAVAERFGGRKPRLDRHEVGNLVFRGFIGLSDPVRPTAREAVSELRRAGVEVRVLTGDHPQTALAVARQLGIDCEGENAVMTGEELEALDDATLSDRVRHVCVYARVTPAHKVRIVRALQENGVAVGMTGDGANDAPAIQLADVGIALGEHATPAARGAADLIVTDGRIETIVRAVVEGRKLWISVRDAVSILLGGNLGEIGYTVLGNLATGRPPLNARQLLLVNLFTDAIPAMVIAMMPPAGVSAERLLEEGPDRSLDERLTRELAWRATVTAGTGILGWSLARSTGSRRCADTVGLVSLVGGQLTQTMVVGHRSPLVIGASLASLAGLLAVVEIPGVSRFFGCRPLGPIALSPAGLAVGVGTVVSMGVPLLVSRVGPRVRAWAEQEDLRNQEWVRLVAESRAASRFRGRVERLREALGAEGPQEAAP